MGNLLDELDSYGGGPPLNDTAAPVVAASSAGYSINPEIAKGIGSAIGGIGAGLGGALAGAFAPKTPTQYYAVPRSSPLPIIAAAGAGLLVLLLVLRRK